MCGAVTQQLLSVAPPSSRIEVATDLDPEVERTDLIDIVGHPAAHPTGESLRYRTDRMGGLSDTRHGILRTGRALHVGEEKCPVFGLKSASKLSDDACLSHAPLAGQEYVIAIFNQPFQDSQIRFAVEEVVTAYPATRG